MSNATRLLSRPPTAVLIAWALLWTGTPAAAQQAAGNPDIAELDAYIAHAVAEWRIPGLAIAVVKDDSIVFAKGYGVRELGEQDPVETGTRFAIGSTTKAMTAIALGMLVDEGKVEWDAPVIRYLPGFRVADPYVTRELTVRDLLTHRGGLGNADLLWTGADYSTAEIIRRVATIEPAYSIRSRFVYQNIMYAVAGQVVAATAGVPWAEFVRTRIFEPLEMHATVATLGELAGQPDVATPHMEIRDTIRTVANRPVDAVAPAGSVWSSAGDMAKWMRFVLDSARVGDRRLLSAQTYREILSPQVVAPLDMYPTTSVIRPHFFTYGLGWFLHDYAGEAVAMHTGSIAGMSALIGLLPDRRLGVYVLANLDHAELRHALMYRVFDRYTEKPPRDWSTELRALFSELEDQAVAARDQQRDRRVRDTEPSLPRERFTGTYTHPTYGDAVVSEQAGALHFAFGSRTATLTHWHYDTFQAQWDDVRTSPSLIAFATDGTGGVSALRAFGLTFARVASKLPEPGSRLPDSRAGAAAMGGGRPWGLGIGDWGSGEWLSFMYRGFAHSL
jgi:CubicO group peptidase (beta-lactamase class C family)